VVFPYVLILALPLCLRSGLRRLQQYHFGMAVAIRTHCSGIEEMLDYRLAVVDSHCFVVEGVWELVLYSEYADCEFAD
jgi:hypothetical protein